MRFISLQHAGAQAREAAVRFPLVLLSAAVATGAGLVLVGNERSEPAIRILLTALPGLPLFTALGTTAERAGWTGTRRAITQGVAIALLLMLWWFFGRWTESMRFIRFAHVIVLAHLCVAVLPFVRTQLARSFWQYNRILFLRYLTGALFASVLFGGLAIALVAIDKLFSVHIAPPWYGRLWVVIALLFHPWFFLSGVPRDLTGLESRDDYPAVLKVFSQFILMPVVSVYMLILTAYLVRVIITHTWPSGWIGYLVSSVAVAGTLALLLVHPLRERADSRWVDAYGRWFFVALLPSVGMLLMATWLRVHQYGLTERRYFLAVLALWLAAIAVYYAITGTRDIRMIPTTLAVIAALTFAGPWSAYSVSRVSQTNRLRDILGRDEILVQSRLARSSRAVSFDDSREISAIVRYLLDVHGPRALSPISVELRSVAERIPQQAPERYGVDNEVARAVVERLGVGYVSRWQTNGAERETRFFASGRHAILVEGYQWMTTTTIAAPFSNTPVLVPMDGDTISFVADSQPDRLIFSRQGARLLEVPLSQLLPLARAAERADTVVRSDSLRAGGAASPRAVAVAVDTARTRIPPPPTKGPRDIRPLILDAEGGGLRVRLVVSRLTITGEEPKARLTNADMTILLGTAVSRVDGRPTVPKPR